VKIRDISDRTVRVNRIREVIQAVEQAFQEHEKCSIVDVVRESEKFYQAEESW